MRSDGPARPWAIAPALLFLLASPIGGTEPVPLAADGPAFRSGDPIVVTTYFYWYDVDPKAPPTGGYTIHPPSWEGVSYKLPSWHRLQLLDMEYAGVDIALPDYWGHPGAEDRPGAPDFWCFEGIRKLVEARAGLVGEGHRPPGIGMFYDTTTLDVDSNPATENGRDVTTPEGKDFVYRTVSGFFRLVPPEHRATIDGEAVLFLYNLSFASRIDASLFPYIEDRFRREFGLGLRIVKDREDLGAVPASDPAARALGDRIGRHELTPWRARASLLASDEFFKKAGGTNAGFVDRLYYAVLRRLPDPASKARWLALLDRGAPRETVATEILEGVGRSESHRVQVADWYKHFLDRPQPLEWLKGHMADPGFADRTMGRLAAGLDGGMPHEAALREILGSREFLRRSGNTTEGFVRRIYETLLYRCPLGREVDDWVSRINQQVALGGFLSLDAAQPVRRDVAARFLATPEAMHLMVARWYAQDLGRAPYWPGYADGVYNWGGALCPGYFSVASIGPGYDDSMVPGRRPRRVDRRGGRHYRDAWETLLAMHPRPAIVHIETWNEYYEATGIADSREYGRAYLDMTRAFTARYHGR